MLSFQKMKGWKEISFIIGLCGVPRSNSISNYSSMSLSKAKIPVVAIHSYCCDKKISTTIDMPMIGLGTYKFKKGSGDTSKAVEKALKMGYTLIDTAFIYGGEQTEKEIGTTLSSKFFTSSSSSSWKRSDIFITSKQWRAYHGYEATIQCCHKSLQRLQTDYLDLYLIHWPGCAYNTMNRKRKVMEESPEGPFVYAKEGHGSNELQSLRAETWRAMEDLLYEGKCRAIGVSNFTVQHLQKLKQTARYWPPAVNQIELHPYNPQTQLVDYCKKEGIVIQAYASLGGQDSGKKTWNVLGGKLLERHEVITIANKYGKTPAQVLLRWATQQGFCVIPKSSNTLHLQQNLEAVTIHNDNDHNHDDTLQNDFHLSPEDFQVLSTLDQSSSPTSRLCWIRDPLKMLDFD